MPTPFPGMDPYLEEPGLWTEFHARLLLEISTTLNQELPQQYIARFDRYVWIDEPEESPQRLGKPDVFVSIQHEQAGQVGAVATLAAPGRATLPVPNDSGKPFLKIIDAHGKRVVTVIELLSPVNKSAKGKELYLAKRQEYCGRTNLVEIDFLRGGDRPPLDSRRPPGDYFIVVCRADEYPEASIWSLSVRDRLPMLSIPLDPGVAPVSLDLRSCLERAYSEGRLDEDIDYQQPPIPPLSEPDATWAKDLLAARPS